MSRRLVSWWALVAVAAAGLVVNILVEEPVPVLSSAFFGAALAFAYVGMAGEAIRRRLGGRA
jgi:hypothetical protein